MIMLSSPTFCIFIPCIILVVVSYPESLLMDILTGFLEYTGWLEVKIVRETINKRNMNFFIRLQVKLSNILGHKTTENKMCYTFMENNYTSKVTNPI